ncbi:MAG: IS21 family transposase [Gemmatimonadetes bacterium]|nr:IS21 family transposase [Gemmatimonadota bacterium]
MYSWETLVLLRHLLDQGLGKTAIAEQTGVSRGLIYHLLRTGQLDRDLAAPRPARARPRVPHKLDDYCAIIDARLTTYPALSAVRLMAECRAAGYTGGYSQLREYVRSVRPRATPEPIVRFETPPGHQAQVDFAEVRFPWGKRYALLVVLGYSRLLWVQFAPRQTMQVLMTGLEAAFLAFGGVPRELLFDQLKAVVIAEVSARAADGSSKMRSSRDSPRTGGFAFAPVARIARRPKAKSSDRSAISAPTSCTGARFSATRTSPISSPAWLADVANQRVHCHDAASGRRSALRAMSRRTCSRSPRARIARSC